MSETFDLTKEALIERIDESWQALSEQLAQLSEEEMTYKRDEAGWAVKDHVIHLAFWERSALYLLEGRPRSAGLGVDDELVVQGDVDAINDELFRQNAGFTVEGAMERLQMVHQQMIEVLEPMTEADLHTNVGYYLRQRRGTGDQRPVVDVVYANTAEHYDEHLAWIQALLAGNQEEAASDQ
jgi:hypothetical protein